LTLFVDASAMIAILADEPEKDRLLNGVLDDPHPIGSAMSCWETVSGLRRSHGTGIDEARRRVEHMLATVAIRIVPIHRGEMTLALDAYQQLGKGRHPAALNMGDCFAYACAKTNDARLLYKGDDFSHTDLA
jgi:ribonuclease VapC